LDPSDHRVFYEAFALRSATGADLASAVGEWARGHDPTSAPHNVDFGLTMQLPMFSNFGLYRSEKVERSNHSLLPRVYLTWIEVAPN